MALKHILKLTEHEAVVKCYVTASGGDTVDISLQTDLSRPNEVYVPGVSQVSIRQIYWGTKQNKQLDIVRVVPEDPNGIHSHYYFTNSGSYDYKGFVDNIYPTKDIRIIGDGAFHVIFVLAKSGWNNKIEPWAYGPYDDINVVGS